jgi:hypothetical protein
MPNKNNNNNIYDIRDLLSSEDYDRAKQSENNIKYKNIKTLNSLHTIDLHKTRSANESSSSSTQPLAKINVIGVSLAHLDSKKPNRQKISVSVCKDSGEVSNYSCSLAPYERKRELLHNIPQDKQDWWGYTRAIEFVTNLDDKSGAYIGKLKNTTTYKLGVPKNMPIVLRTAVVLWAEGNELHTMLWMGDNEYHIQLYSESLNSKQKQFFVANGYYKDETTEIVEEF